MKITDALYGEHGTLYALFEHLEASAAEWELADLLMAGRVLDAALLSHAALADELLFAALDSRLPGPGPLAAMRAEHVEIDRFLAGLREAQDESTARRNLVHAVALARDHFAKEEAVLFPLAEQLLGAPALARLGDLWAGRRGVAVAA
jgi:iron-sulfur cluster repair protein YtfE (RIC family)